MTDQHSTLPVRYLTVTATTPLTPHLRRITFGGPDLADFRYQPPDQQVKLYFPRTGQAEPIMPPAGSDGDVYRWYQAFTDIPEPDRPWMRSYTIRAHHPDRQEIDIDFVLHADAGPATHWAATATAGQRLGMFGPSAAFARRVPLATSLAEADWVLLVGDETALPAIGTLAEALPAGKPALAYLEVGGPADELALATEGELAVHWRHRGELPPGHGEGLLAAVRAAEFPAGRVFAWLAGEAGAVRVLRRHLVADRGVPKSDIDFTGNWRLTLSQDDAPTEADLAEAQERLAELAEQAEQS